MSGLNINGIPVDPVTMRRYRELISDPAYFDRNAIGHDLAVEEMTAFHEQLVQSAAPAGSTNAGSGAPAPNSPAAEAAHQRIAELQKHAAYADAHHPEHRAIVDELGAAYRQLTGEADPAGQSGAASDGANQAPASSGDGAG